MKKTLFILLLFGFVKISIAGWAFVNMGTTNDFTDICLSNAQTFYATTINPANYTGVFYKSTNGGTNWFQLPLPSGFMAPYTCHIGSDGLVGFVVGTSIIKTSNGGVNWIPAYTPTDTVIFFGADLSSGSPKAFWAVGNRMIFQSSEPVIVRCPSFFSSNAYTRMTLPSGMSSYELTSVAAIDSNGCLIGVNRGASPGLILRTTDRGNNWATITMPAGISIWSIDLDGGGGGFAAGGNNDIAHIYWTANWGATWSLVYSANIGHIKGLHYYGAFGSFAVGHSGSILRNTGSESPWTLQNSGVMSQLNAISVLNSNENIIYAVGDNGIMLKTDNGGIGIQKISTEIPNKFSLSQNYPNPFNPKTIINFQLPMSNYVKLYIYDALGREIGTLVNEQLKAGTYQVDWQADSYASGVYYYKLITDGFSETKKMILIK
ncbi:MAG: T9SS C-terminal target domain-containing protein [Ignavibacteriae bacterium]|nr:MAG: T9SS C-terminal target domain-containing protein [Ignavibacteriota bacterium]